MSQYGNKTFNRNIGDLKLTPKQNNNYNKYFLPAAIKWEYMPCINGIQSIRDFFIKYYGQRYANIYCNYYFVLESILNHLYFY